MKPKSSISRAIARRSRIQNSLRRSQDMRSRNPLIDGLACAVKKCIDEGKVPFFHVYLLNRFCKGSDIFDDYPIKGGRDRASEETLEMLKVLGLVEFFRSINPYVLVSRKMVDKFYDKIPEREKFGKYGDEILEKALCDSEGYVRNKSEKRSGFTEYNPDVSAHNF